MTDTDRMLVDRDDHGVLVVTMNRPERKNAFDERQWDALSETLHEADADPRVAVLVLTGAGGNFSSGVDLSSFTGDPPEMRDDGRARAYADCVDSLYSFAKPLLAAVTGVAIGGGCTIAVACDIVYVGAGLRARLPFANLGVVPEIASSYSLQSAIGRQRANEVMFTAEWIGAERAVELGMAARSFPDEELLDATLAKAREIAQWPTSALVGIKRTLRAVHEAAINAALDVENDEMSRLAGSPENIEAVMAFIEKREPDFRQFRS